MAPKYTKKIGTHYKLELKIPQHQQEHMQYGGMITLFSDDMPIRTTFYTTWDKALSIYRSIATVTTLIDKFGMDRNVKIKKSHGNRAPAMETNVEGLKSDLHHIMKEAHTLREEGKTPKQVRKILANKYGHRLELYYPLFAEALRMNAKGVPPSQIEAYIRDRSTHRRVVEISPAMVHRNENGDQICDRCGKPSAYLIMSYFNTQMLCPDCETKERRHPKFETARRIETEHVRNGDYNFMGIGKPADL